MFREKAEELVVMPVCQVGHTGALPIISRKTRQLPRKLSFIIF
jgi:hypothetical protein